MNWRNVFDCSKGCWQTKQEAAAVAARCGYRFMAWEQDVLFIVDDEGDTRETRIHVDELKLKSR